MTSTLCGVGGVTSAAAIYNDGNPIHKISKKSFDSKDNVIISHSALKEGWDNPNVFQICILKHSDSTLKNGRRLVAA
ncbi:hypothetical protein [Paenibacillus sp. FSL H8-0034]|uniref:hypothetical protein n=1 Tax=Paenibacillus sp. FSL H8-0034 TaxID=2954671 RepID=UPI0030FA6D62